MHCRLCRVSTDVDRIWTFGTSLRPNVVIHFLGRSNSRIGKKNGRFGQPLLLSHMCSIHRRLLVMGICAHLDFDVKQNTFTFTFLHKSFHIIRSDRTIAAMVRGGGVAFLLHPSVQFQLRQDLVPLNLSQKFYVFKSFHVIDQHNDVFACYRSPRTDSKLFLSELQSLIMHVSEPIAHIIAPW